MSALTYRLAEVADAEALADFAARTFVETFGHLYPPDDLAAYLAHSYTAAIQRAELADAQIGCALALQQGDIVGYCMWGPVDMQVEHAPGSREIYRLYVDASLKGAGVARALMDMALQRLHGADALYLSVWENNLRAQRFYRRYGFEHIGEHKFMVGATADRDFIWRLDMARVEPATK